MPPARIVVYLMMDGTQFDAASDAARLKGDAVGDSIGNAGKRGADEFATAFEGAKGRLSSVFNDIGNELNNLGIPFGNTFKKMSLSMDEASASGTGLIEKMKLLGAVTIAVGAAAAVGIAVEGVKQYEKLSDAVSTLKTQVQDVGTSFKSVSPQIQAMDQAMVHFGHDSADTDTALADLIRATGSVSKSMKDMTLVSNMAAFSHTSLAAASQNLNSILAGSSRTLREYGINANVTASDLHAQQMAQEALVKAQQNYNSVSAEAAAGQLSSASGMATVTKATTALRDAHIAVNQAENSGNHILSILSERMKGQAASAADTLSGRIATLRASMDNWAASVGGKVVKALDILADAANHVISFLERFKVISLGLAGALGLVLATSIGIVLVSAIVKFFAWLVTLGGKYDTWGLKTKVLTDSHTKLALAISKAGIATGQMGTEQSTAAEPVQLLTAEVREQMIAFNGTMQAVADLDVALGNDVIAQQAVSGAIGESTAALIAERNAALLADAALAMPVAIFVAGAAAIGVAIGGLILLWGKLSLAADKAKIAQGLANRVTQDKAQADINTAKSASSSTTARDAAEAGLERQIKAGDAYLKRMTAYTVAPEGRDVRPETEHHAVEKGTAASTEQQYIQALTNQLKQMNENDVSTLAHPQIQSITQAVEQQTQKQDEAEQKKANETKIHVEKVANAALSTGQSFLEGQQNTLTTASMQALTDATTAVQKAGMQQEVTALLSLHEKKLTALAEQIEAAWKQEIGEMAQWNMNQTMIQTADVAQAMATWVTDTTAIISDMSAEVVQNITDVSSKATAQAQQQSDLYASQAQTQADILGERGLYGLNLVVQRMKVGLDQVTGNYQQQEDTQSTQIAAITETGNSAIAAAKLKLDQVQRTTDVSVAAQQKITDLLANPGTTVQQVVAQSGLKGAQAQQALLLANANQNLTNIQDKQNQQLAVANAQLATTKATAQTQEAKLSALISVEQAKANTEFAGSGVHIEITGINPTDATAVGQAVSWHLRTKVAR